MIRAAGGYWAFVPAPPPPWIVYDEGLAILLSEADAALSELSGMGWFLPNPDLLIEPYVRREAVASSHIEGTQASLADLLIDEIEPSRTPPGSDVREVRNYVEALRHGIARLEVLPISGRLLKEIHAILMHDVRGQERTPGEFRRSQNWIGPPGCTLESATYVPPPHDPEMHECLRRWEIFANERGQMPELIQCALLHENFEAIHPFLDGNGRVGRLLITLFLIERGRLSKPLLYLSSYIDRHRSEYYRHLQRVRTNGEWADWIRFFLVGVRETSRMAIAQSRAIIVLCEDYRARLSGNRRAAALVDQLFINPYVTAATAARALGVSLPTARKTIGDLEQFGMLAELTGGKWGRIWVARPILQAFESPPEHFNSA